MASAGSREAGSENACGVPAWRDGHGIRFDFNLGCRLFLPERSDGLWKVRMSDADTGNCLLEKEVVSGWVCSDTTYFVPWLIEIDVNGQRVFEHRFQARDKDVLVRMPFGALGDTIAWFPCAVKFQRQHGCRLTCAMPAWLIPLFRDAYPDIGFVTPESATAGRFYATYTLAIYSAADACRHQPTDFRLAGLQRVAAYILGVDTAETPPRIDVPDHGRPIQQRYVCIGAQSTAQCKMWNNPSGWQEIVNFLKAQGYRVVCIDKHPVYGAAPVWNHIPAGAEDETGDRPLRERAHWLKHADFFVGLSSGLSWLAWAVGTPTVLISGFTHPLNEFSTPYRIINQHVCNSCGNDMRELFDADDYFWCPRHADTPRQFECTRRITAEHVLGAIRRIPSFGSFTSPAPVRSTGAGSPPRAAPEEDAGVLQPPEPAGCVRDHETVTRTSLNPVSAA